MPRRCRYGSARRAARQLQLRDAGRRRPDLRRALRFGRARLSRRRARSTAIGKTPAACKYTSCRDDEALAAFDLLARTEGILPALESSHAVAKAMELAAQAARRRSRRGLPLRPRRQRRGRNRPAARRIVRLIPVNCTAVDRVDHVRHRRTLSQASRRRPQGADAVRHGRRSRSGVHRRRAGRNWSRRGSSLCELGIPYSDPIADGPVIQASYTRALAHKIKLAEILEYCRPASRRS